MRNWFYAEEGQRKGPISETDLVGLFESGKLLPDTLVWTESLKNWQAAHSIEGLLPASLALPPQANGAEPSPLDVAPSGPQVRPWVRYWARSLDIMLFAVLTGIILGLIFPAALEIHDSLLGIMFAFAYVFVEPIMLSSWGTTPGKALLRVRIRRNDGFKPSYAEALSRSFNVWVRGLGLGIPLVALIAQINAYSKLTNNGITSWDQDGAFCVSHKVVGVWRIMAVIALFFVFMLLMIIGKIGSVE